MARLQEKTVKISMMLMALQSADREMAIRSKAAAAAAKRQSLKDTYKVSDIDFNWERHNSSKQAKTKDDADCVLLLDGDASNVTPALPKENGSLLGNGLPPLNSEDVSESKGEEEEAAPETCAQDVSRFEQTDEIIVNQIEQTDEIMVSQIEQTGAIINQNEQMDVVIISQIDQSDAAIAPSTASGNNTEADIASIIKMDNDLPDRLEAAKPSEPIAEPVLESTKVYKAKPKTGVSVSKPKSRSVSREKSKEVKTRKTTAAPKNDRTNKN